MALTSLDTRVFLAGPRDDETKETEMPGLNEFEVLNGAIEDLKGSLSALTDLVNLKVSAAEAIYVKAIDREKAILSRLTALESSSNGSTD